MYSSQRVLALVRAYAGLTKGFKKSGAIPCPEALTTWCALAQRRANVSDIHASQGERALRRAGALAASTICLPGNFRHVR
jgi:hypothetical protein